MQTFWQNLQNAMCSITQVVKKETQPGKNDLEI